jgi:hypothetical protein
MREPGLGPLSESELERSGWWREDLWPAKRNKSPALYGKESRWTRMKGLEILGGDYVLFGRAGELEDKTQLSDMKGDVLTQSANDKQKPTLSVFAA